MIWSSTFTPHVRAGSVGSGEGYASGCLSQNNLTGAIALGPGTAARLQHMDKEGIDYQAINVNAWGYSADRALARDLVQLQNEKIAAAVAAHPDRFVGMATLALQHPDLAAEQLDYAVKSWACAAPPSAAASKGRSLGSQVRSVLGEGGRARRAAVHAPAARARARRRTRGCKGKGGLGNTIGNPLETTVFLSHLIFEGTLDRFPGSEDLRAHTRAATCRPTADGRTRLWSRAAQRRRLQGAQEEAERVLQAQLFIDTMIFHEEGLRHLVAEVGVGQMLLRDRLPV